MTKDNSKRICVAGQPRSGTSMMMRVLQFGGIPVDYDEELNTEARHKIFGNRYGFYEVKRPRGNCKIISPEGLKQIPEATIIYIRRNIEQVIKSWESSTKQANRERIHRKRIEMERALSRFPHITINYEDMHSDPRKQCERIKKFLGKFDVDKAVKAVDKTLLVKR